MPRPALIAPRFALVMALLAPSAASADHVVLSPKAGGFAFEGDLANFNGTDFVLETAAGSMTLPASAFNCISGACPAVSAPRTSKAAPEVPVGPTHIAMAGSIALGNELVPDLLRGFAASRGETAVETVRNDKSSLARFEFTRAGKPADVIVDMERRGTGDGFAQLASGAVVLAMAGRPITPTELAQLPQPAANGANRYDATVVALDGVAILMSPKRALEGPAPGRRALAGLTTAQLGGIVSGRIRDWSELGLAAGPIKVYLPDVGAGALDVFSALVLKPLGLVASPLATRMDDLAQMADLVAADPNAIAIASWAFQREAKAVAIVEPCGIVAPLSPFAVKTEDYPLSRRLYLYSTGTLPPVAADFVSYAVGPDAQATVAARHFVDQSIVVGPSAADTPRITTRIERGTPPLLAAQQRRIAGDLAGLSRLSATLRFATNTSRLDERARDDVRRLAAWLAAPPNAGVSIMLVGYSDTVGTVPINIGLSLKRAEQVRGAVLAAGAGAIAPDRIGVRGYGPVAPVACNTTPTGQDLNRRVEVWIKK